MAPAPLCLSQALNFTITTHLVECLSVDTDSPKDLVLAATDSHQLPANAGTVVESRIHSSLA
jgi:hypothetical protein